MQLIARSITEYVTRLLADEDYAAGEGGTRPLAAALGNASEALYQGGAIHKSTMPTYAAYIVRNIGHFSDISSTLINSHLGRKDEV